MVFRKIYDWATKPAPLSPAEQAAEQSRRDANDVQKLLDRKVIKMYKTKEVRATDLPGEPVTFLYRFMFDSEARRQQFLAAISQAPPQSWDPWVRWMEDISHLAANPWRGTKEGTGEVEICVEAQCRIPDEELGRFQFHFNEFITKKILLK